MWTSGAAVPRLPQLQRVRRFRCSAATKDPEKLALPQPEQKKVVVVGCGWAGLGAAHHLSKQGFNVTVLDSGSCPAEDVGIRGFWYPYQNIFSVINELGLSPFTKWTRSAHYSTGGKEVEYPVFQDVPRLPTPLGALIYPQFTRLPLTDRLTSLPLAAAAIDFDNTDTAWRKYDAMTAGELFRKFGCSERVYKDAIEPLVQVGLLAPAEQCSASATLGMLYYYILAHQQNFDVSWCRGSVIEKIFVPWMEKLKARCNFVENKGVIDFLIDKSSGHITGVCCGQETYDADAFVLAVGVSTLQSIIMSSFVLQQQKDFLNVLNLATTDIVSVRVWFDKKINIPKESNVCFGLDDLIAWTFFDLNSIYDEYEDEEATVLEANFFYAKQLLPLKDKQIVAKLVSYLSECNKRFSNAKVLRHRVVRFPNSTTHFFPGSYRYMMRGSTSFPNMFVAGDWIITRHGSWGQEKEYVTGLEAANRVVDYLGEGNFAKIIPLEEEEPHIEALRGLNRRTGEIKSQIQLPDQIFPQVA